MKFNIVLFLASAATVAATNSPTKSPSNQPSSQPSEQPSNQPSSQPSEQPSSQPSESPSEQPSSQPSESPSDLPSSQPSESPSSQPSESPSEQPSSQPSESPSSQPSESPSDRPSSQPSESPSDMPSSSPSSQPSSEPSESPSSMPSSEPSETPSCTPSSAPTPSPSINLFYPDQTSNGFETGCLNDGAQPAWMENNPTNWLFSSLQRCCETHFSWNLQYCTGSIDDTCARAYWYPNWEGNGDGCVRDGDEPFYMLQHSGHYLFSTKADCCDEHYSWDYSTCMGGAGGSSSGSSYYADWTSGDETCKNDGAAPEYMVSNTQWLHDTREACCARHFSYKKGECMGTSTSTTGTGKYFPDWAGDNSGCLVDGGSNVAPDYMHSSSSWLFDSLEACCDQHYSWNKNGCMGSGGTSTVTGSMKWYVNWSDHKCYKDCETATDCGGLAESWEILHDSQSDCCSAHVSYDTKSCKDI